MDSDCALAVEDWDCKFATSNWQIPGALEMEHSAGAGRILSVHLH